MIPVVISLEIIESPSPVEVLQGLPASLICRTSFPSQGVTWYKDGSRVNQEEGRCLVLPDGSLFFLNTVLEDTGDYYCAVNDRTTIVNSNHARLSVVQREAEKSILEEENEREKVPSLVFSLRHKKKFSRGMSMEVSLDAEDVRWSKPDSIPTLLWVIAFLTVIMMILLIILVMIIIVIRSRRVPRRESVSEVEYGNNLKQLTPNHQHAAKHKDNEKNTSIDIVDHIYDYATSDQYIFPTKFSDITSSDYSQDYPLLQNNQPLI